MGGLSLRTSLSRRVFLTKRGQRSFLSWTIVAKRIWYRKYSQLSANGHLCKTDISIKRTLFAGTNRFCIGFTIMKLSIKRTPPQHGQGTVFMIIKEKTLCKRDSLKKIFARYFPITIINQHFSTQVANNTPEAMCEFKCY